MLRLSVVLSALHFALSVGLHYGFSRLSRVDSELARECLNFAEKIEFVLTQPGRVLQENFQWADGSPGFWVLLVATSLLWGNAAAFLFRRVLSALFR